MSQKKGKWRGVSIYEPLMKEVEKLIDEGVILLPNASQFVQSVVEREVNRLKGL